MEIRLSGNPDYHPIMQADPCTLGVIYRTFTQIREFQLNTICNDIVLQSLIQQCWKSMLLCDLQNQRKEGHVKLISICLLAIDFTSTSVIEQRENVRWAKSHELKDGFYKVIISIPCQYKSVIYVICFPNNSACKLLSDWVFRDVSIHNCGKSGPI